LGLTPHATQAQIKEAYYKLSMKYHPDRNQGSQTAHDTFSEITEAYAVLGQNQTRRRYDKGLLREYPQPRRSQQSMDARGGQSNKTAEAPKYDFDAFYQAHYGEALKREQMARRRRATNKSDDIPLPLSGGQQRLLMVTVVLLVLLCGWHWGWSVYGNNLKKQREINR
jgi:DnaJ family protein C protein 30